MKVGKLIELLQNENADAEVFFSYNYGDRSSTNVAQEVKRVEEQPLGWSEYHRMYALLSDVEEEEGKQFDEDTKRAVVLR